MDSALIKQFRNRVNDGDWVLHVYRNYNGINQWSVICSAMDWIEVVIESIDTKNLMRGNDNESSLRMINFISCIDLLWEAVQQLHRVFINAKSIPFQTEKSIFQHKLYDTTDNIYFKTIRACFAAHPINLNDYFVDASEKEQRYAGWSGGTFGAGDFSVMLYSNQPNKVSIPFDIYFSELIEFARSRYEYLNVIQEEIDRQQEQYFAKWRNIKIKRTLSQMEQIDILLEEEKQRFDNAYYNYELEKLRIIFSTPIANKQNQKIVNAYQSALEKEIEEIFFTLQEMKEICELQSTREVDGALPFDCQYAFSKLSDAVYGGIYPFFLDIEKFQSHLNGIINFTGYKSAQELYVLVMAGFFALRHGIK